MVGTLGTLTFQPVRLISLYKVAELSRHAFAKPITIDIITSSFTAAGIHLSTKIYSQMVQVQGSL